jgi:hypothetical protein
MGKVPIITWLTRLIDESNTWFSAVKAEQSSRFLDAANLYLNDARTNLENGLPLRVALSCSCAASCVEKLGDITNALLLYGRAASIYEENAEPNDKKITERVWSLDRAYFLFLLAEDSRNSAKVHREMLLLQRETSWFFNVPEMIERSKTDVAELTRSRKSSNILQTPPPLLEKSINELLLMCRTRLETVPGVVASEQTRRMQ